MSWGDVWGYSPRRAATECAEAFYAGKPLRRTNVHTNGSYYTLFDWVIAERIRPEDIASVVAAKLMGDPAVRHRKLLAFRWPVVDRGRYPAVARHFRALGFADDDEGRYTQREQRPVTIYGREITPNQWFTHEELAARPLWVPSSPPYKPPPKPRFVNLTLALFPS